MFGCQPTSVPRRVCATEWLVWRALQKVLVAWDVMELPLDTEVALAKIGDVWTCFDPKYKKQLLATTSIPVDKLRCGNVVVEPEKVCGQVEYTPHYPQRVPVESFTTDSQQRLRWYALQRQDFATELFRLRGPEPHTTDRLLEGHFTNACGPDAILLQLCLQHKTRASTKQRPEARASTKQRSETRASTKQRPEARASTKQRSETRTSTKQQPEARTSTKQRPEARAYTKQQPKPGLPR
ncbi:hypothetical protein GNI_145240, partial [Gregarina niphandrodes]